MSKFSIYWAVLVGFLVGIISVAWGLPLLPYAVVVPSSTARQPLISVAIAGSAGLLIDLIRLETVPFVSLSLIVVSVLNYWLFSHYVKQSEFVACVVSILFISGIYAILQYWAGYVVIEQTFIHTISAVLVGVGLWYIFNREHFSRFQLD